MGLILVQRIKGRVPCEERNIDKRFRLDYMGACEFERGILFASFKLMRSRPCEVLQIQRDNLWFVGDPKDCDFAAEFAESQIYSDNAREFHGRRLKEITRMSRCVAEDATDTIGWWWLSQDGWPEKERASEPTWCLFKSESDAIAWAECCDNAPVA